MTPVVSVIIPTYKRPEYLRRAIKSVLSQSFQNFELIVVENGDSVEGRDVVSKFQAANHRVRYLYRQEPDPCLARNVGITAAKGKYIALLDNNDEWLTTKLERQTAVLDSDPSVGLVTSRGWWVDAQGRTFAEIPTNFRGAPSYTDLVLMGCFIYTLSSVMIRRSCLDEVGLFDSRYFIANDYDLYLRLARKYRFASIEQPLFKYYQHPGGMSQDVWRTKWEMIEILKALPPTPVDGVTRRMVNRRVAELSHMIGAKAMDRKQYGSAIRGYLTALCYDPFIGVRVSWGRFANPLYRLLRPYGAVIYCLFLWGQRAIGLGHSYAED